MARFFSLWRNLTRRDRIERELDEEMRATVDALVAEKMAAGLHPNQARRQALLELGGVESVKQQVRDARSGALVETFLQDLRYAARLLRRNPLFALTAALSLAIGIGATTSIFTVGNALLFRTAPGVADPDSLVDIVSLERGAEFEPGVEPFSFPNYLDLRRRLTTLDHIYGYELQLRQASLRSADTTERVFVTFVTSGYFRALGVTAVAGRTIDAGDGDEPGGVPLVVLSHRYWQRRFNGDAGVIGREVQLNGHPFTVAGVARDGFYGTTVAAPDVWVPASMAALVRGDETNVLSIREAGWLMLGGRLKPGVSRAQASREVRAIGAALAREFPRDPNSPYGPPGHASIVFDWSAEIASPIPYGLRIIATGLLALLMALVSTVLVIACANVAGVLLARATVRRREIAVRTAIGAARARLVRQLLTETLLLFSLSGIAGIALAAVLASALLRLLPAFPIPIELSAPLDVRVVAFSLALSFVAAILAGIAPALHASKADVVTSLKDDSQGPVDRLRLRSVFVVAQVAFSILLVVMAGTFVKGFDNRLTIDRGFDPVNVDVATIDLTMGGYDEVRGREVARDLIERARAIPGVRVATVANRVPDSGGMSLGELTVPGVAPPDGQNSFRANWTLVDSDYFATLRIPLVAGRDFMAGDRSNTEPVAILGERAARRFWPGKDPVGQFLFVKSGMEREPQRLTVVGVVRDVSMGNTNTLDLYVPLQQRFQPGIAILARNDGRGSVAEPLRTLVMRAYPDLPILTAEPLDRARTGPAETQLRVVASVAAGVGLVGVLLAAMGIYGVTAYTVIRRTREIGIRLSLGAGKPAVVALVLRHGMMLVGIGSAIGLALAAAATRLLASSRFAAASPDAVTYAGALIFLVVVGLAACYVPVRRAARLGATEALRHE
jgi:predicted permease